MDTKQKIKNKQIEFFVQIKSIKKLFSRRKYYFEICLASWVQQIKFTFHSSQRMPQQLVFPLSTPKHANSPKNAHFHICRFRQKSWIAMICGRLARSNPFYWPPSRPSSFIHPPYFLLLSLILQNYSFPPTNPLINVYADLLILAVPHRLAHPSSSSLFFLLSAIVVAFSFFTQIFRFFPFFFFAITRWSFRLFFFCPFLPWSCQVTEPKSERA